MPGQTVVPRKPALKKAPTFATAHRTRRSDRPRTPIPRPRTRRPIRATETGIFDRPAGRSNTRTQLTPPPVSLGRHEGLDLRLAQRRQVAHPSVFVFGEEVDRDPQQDRPPDASGLEELPDLREVREPPRQA